MSVTAMAQVYDAAAKLLARERVLLGGEQFDLSSSEREALERLAAKSRLNPDTLDALARAELAHERSAA